MNTEGVEFVLKLKDYMSGGLQRIAGSAQKSFKSVDTTISGTMRKMRTASASVDQINKQLNELTKRRNISVDTSEIRRANREIGQLERDLARLERTGNRYSGGGNVSGRRGGMLPGIGAIGRRAAGIATIAGAAGIAALGGGAVYAANAGLQGGAQKMSFQTLAGDKAGTKLYEELTDYAQKSIFGNEVYKNAQTQLAFGAKVGDVMHDSRMLGDVSMGNKDRLGSLNLAYSQSMANGRLTGQDNLQFVNAGFNPLQELSIMTGKKLPELRKEMEKGNITFEMVRKSFEHATSEGGKFYKMTDRIAATPFGKMEAVKGQLQGLGLQAGTVIAPVVGELIDKVAAPALEGISANIEPVTKEILSDLREFAPYVRDVLGSAVDLAKPIIATLRSSEFKDLGKSLIDLTGTVLHDLIPAFNLVGKIAGFAAKILTPVVNGVNTLLSPTQQPGFQKMSKDVMAYRKEQRVTDSIMVPYQDARRKSLLNGGKSDWRRDKREEDSLKNIIAGSLKPIADKRQNMMSIAQGVIGYGIVPVPRRTAPAATVTPSGKTSSTTDFSGLGGSSADAITKGGPKKIEIHFHAPLNQSTYTVRGDKEAAEQGSNDTVEQLLRALNSLGAQKED